MSIINKNTINLATKTVTNLINSNSSSRRTTVEEIVAVMSADCSEAITPELVKHLINSGSLNSPGVREFHIVKGRYGGVREVDLEKKVAEVKAAEIKAKRQAAAANARNAKEAKRQAKVVTADISAAA